MAGENINEAAPAPAGPSLNWLVRRTAQSLIEMTVRPYIVRELPGWEKVFHAIIGDYHRDWLWQDAPRRVIRGKRHHYLMHLDLSKWSDRSTYFLGRWVDLHIQQLMTDLVKPGDTVVDIGANQGMFALTASHLVGPAGKVICFEPNPACQRALQREIDTNAIRNINVHPVGLGDHDDELTLTVPLINSGEGSFGKPSYSADTMYEVKAKIRRGDDMLAAETPSFIKIDVEGFECWALKGLTGTIAKHRPVILTEAIAEHLKRCGSSIEELVALMNGLGYRGFELIQAKTSHGYDWQLAPYAAPYPGGDVVWLHADAIRDRANELTSHWR